MPWARVMRASYLFATGVGIFLGALGACGGDGDSPTDVLDVGDVEDAAPDPALRLDRRHWHRTEPVHRRDGEEHQQNPALQEPQVRRRRPRAQVPHRQDRDAAVVRGPTHRTDPAETRRNGPRRRRRAVSQQHRRRAPHSGMANTLSAIWTAHGGAGDRHVEHPSTLGAGSEGRRPDRRHRMSSDLLAATGRGARGDEPPFSRPSQTRGLRARLARRPRSALARGIVTSAIVIFRSTIHGSCRENGLSTRLSTAPPGSARPARKGRSNGISLSEKSRRARGDLSPQHHRRPRRTRVRARRAARRTRGVEPPTPPPAGRGQHALLLDSHARALVLRLQERRARGPRAEAARGRRPTDSPTATTRRSANAIFTARFARPSDSAPPRPPRACSTR